MIKSVLFDKDGTLIDFVGTFAPATRLVIKSLAGEDETIARDMARGVGFDPDTLEIEPSSVLIAGSLQNITDQWLPFVEESDGRVFLKEVDRLYVEHSLASLTPFASLVPVLNELRAKNLTLGIATNDSETAARSHMQKLEVEDRFSFIAGFDSGYGEKPDPGMVRAFASHCAIDARNVAMVGDSVHDCKAGRSAGTCVIAVTSGPAGFDDLQPHADHVIDGLHQLPGLIHMLNAAEGVR